MGCGNCPPLVHFLFFGLKSHLETLLWGHPHGYIRFYLYSVYIYIAYYILYIWYTHIIHLYIISCNIYIYILLYIYIIIYIYIYYYIYIIMYIILCL